MHDAPPEVLDAVLLVGERLGDVDVDARAVAARQVDGPLEQGVAHGEGGVQAHHAAPRLQVALGLRQPALEPLGAVAVGQLVAQQVRQPDAVELLGDREQAALGGVRRGMVVNDEGHPALGSLDGGHRGASAHHVEVELSVEIPPNQLEHLREALGLARRRWHAPSERAVDVVVGDGERARHQLAGAVEPGGAGGDLRHELGAAGRSRLDPDRATLHREGVGVDVARVLEVERFGRHRFIGSVCRRLPSNDQSALATAGAVGTSPISPTPLAP